jgi:hypothetical protein
MLAFISQNLSAEVTQLTATIDKNPMLLDESVTLQVTAIGGADRDAIDFTLLTQNFRVGQPSISQSTQIINFDRTTSTTWTLQLLPTATGQFTIPSFSIDGQTTDQITLTVLPVGQGTRSQPRDFYVTTDVSNDTVYLQQQVQYQVKIYLSEDIQRGSLSEPLLAGAVIEQLGDDKEYQELVNGVRYRVIERNFAILPQASGSYSIDGPVFQAEVLSSTRQSFAYFNRSKTISRMAPQQTLTVLPIPENYPYLWLPSEQVQISEQWQGNDAQFILGEPITRTVTLTALGLIEEQLPSIEAQYHPSFKTYPEQAEMATVKQNNRLIAQLVQNTAIIPSEVGNFVLPEISVPWFDVNSGETRFAVLAAKSVRVLAPALEQNAGSDNGTIQARGTPLGSDLSSDPLANQDNPQANSNSPLPVVVFGLDILHIALGAAVLLLMALAFLLYRRRTYSIITEPGHTDHAPADSEAQAWHRLIGAIEQNNIAAVPPCLREWLHLLTNQPIQSVNNALNSLGAQDAAAAFNDALASQYSSTAQDFNASTLQHALANLREREHHRRASQSHTNMYPIN